MVWQEESNLRHPPCGTFPWEWEDDPDAWHADHYTCEGCRRRGIRQKQVFDSPSADSHAGVVIALYRTPRQED